MSEVQNNKAFADRFVTYKSLAVNLCGCFLVIFTVGTWAMTAFGERLHPDAVNIREMDAFRADIKGNIEDLKVSNKQIHDMLTQILLDKME